MKSICKCCPCIGRDKSVFSNSCHIHISNCWYYLITSEFIIKFLFEQPVYKQWDKACKEMSLNSIIIMQVNWACIEFWFHDAEGFFYFPPVMIDFSNDSGIVIKVCAYSIESIILCVFCNSIKIKGIDFLFSNLTIIGNGCLLNKSFVIVLSDFFNFGFVVNSIFSTLNLSCSDVCLILFVLQRVCNN